jgi:hypothetical protein
MLWTTTLRAARAQASTIILLAAAGCIESPEPADESELVDGCVFVLVTHPAPADEELFALMQLELSRCGQTTETEILCRADSTSIDACREQVLPRLDDLLRDRPGTSAVCVDDCNE